MEMVTATGTQASDKILPTHPPKKQPPKLEQTEIPGTEKRKRRAQGENAVVGDLLVATRKGQVTTIEQVSDSVSGPDIIERWKDQGVVDGASKIDVWECRAGGHYRRRR